MMDSNSIFNLAKAFSYCVSTPNGEIVVHKSGQGFCLCNCETEMDVKCKVLEWFSRATYKTEPYSTKKANEKLHKYMLTGINKFLGTKFTESDMEIIYTYLGNAIRHDKTVEFVQAGYNMDFFKQFNGG